MITVEELEKYCRDYDSRFPPGGQQSCPPEEGLSQISWVRAMILVFFSLTSTANGLHAQRHQKKRFAVRGTFCHFRYFHEGADPLNTHFWVISLMFQPA